MWYYLDVTCNFLSVSVVALNFSEVVILAEHRLASERLYIWQEPLETAEILKVEKKILTRGDREMISGLTIWKWHFKKA